MLFSEIQGEKIRKYDDDKIYIRLKCSKRAGEEQNDILSRVVDIFGFNSSNTMTDIKRAIFNRLDIEIIYEPKARSTIQKKNVNNAADIAFLREKEGRQLIEALGLNTNVTKEEMTETLLKRIGAI